MAICKPAIRKTASVGDWIAATGSKGFPIDQPQRRLIYAMKVTKKLTMRDYDEHCRKALPIKIPKRPAKSYSEFVGDSIFQFSDSSNKIVLLPSVHSKTNRKHDLSGQFVLLSNHFAYFGNQAPLIPETLEGIIKTGRGHQSAKNVPFVQEFERWIEAFELGGILGDPISKCMGWRNSKATGSCSKAHLADDEDDA